MPSPVAPIDPSTAAPDLLDISSGDTGGSHLQSHYIGEKSRVPGTVPWGTPDFTRPDTEELPSTTTFWVLLVRKY